METTRSRKVSKLKQQYMLRTSDNVNWGAANRVRVGKQLQTSDTLKKDK